MGDVGFGSGGGTSDNRGSKGIEACASGRIRRGRSRLSGLSRFLRAYVGCGVVGAVGCEGAASPDSGGRCGTGVRFAERVRFATGVGFAERVRFATGVGFAERVRFATGVGFAERVRFATGVGFAERVRFATGVGFAERVRFATGVGFAERVRFGVRVVRAADLRVVDARLFRAETTFFAAVCFFLLVFDARFFAVVFLRVGVVVRPFGVVPAFLALGSRPVFLSVLRVFGVLIFLADRFLFRAAGFFRWVDPAVRRDRVFDFTIGSTLSNLTTDDKYRIV